MCRTTLALALAFCAVALASPRVALEPDVQLAGGPDGWRFCGAAAPHTPITLTIALALRNAERLDALVAAVAHPRSPSYGRYWTPERVYAYTAPTQGAVRAVTAWLDAHSASHEVLRSGFVEARVRVADAEALLDTTFAEYEHVDTKQRLVRVIGGYTVPAHVAEHVELIGGVIRFPKLSLRARPFVPEDVPVNPLVIQRLYNITVPPPEPKNLQAVVSFLDQWYTPADLAEFQTMNKIAPNPIERDIGENNASDEGVEAALDVQYLTGISENIRTWVYFTPGTRSGGNEPFLAWLSHLDDTQEVPLVFSISYQDLEYTVSRSYAARVNAEFKRHSLMGRTFVTGSGDWGVGCKDQEHCNAFTADFPSSSPFITSLGATRITSGSNEVGIDFSSGGFSNYFVQPSYQSGAIKPFLARGDLPPPQYFNTSGRAFPDISCVGHNFQIVVNGAVNSVDGTSASTPTWAAQVAMLNSLRLSKGLPPMGLVNPFIYSSADLFKDIVSGDEQLHGCCPTGFATVRGWDPYTGLGTPNWGLLAERAMDTTFFSFPPQE